MKKTHKGVFGNEALEIKRPYKEPVFLFTSSSLRFAAYAGWYSAFGQIEKCEDMYKYISGEVMDKLVNKFFKDIKDEIKKGKS